MHGPYEYSKLCESCGMGVLHAALLSAEDSGEEELEEEEEEEGALEQEGEDEVSEGAPESKSVQPAKAKRAAARGKPSKQVRHSKHSLGTGMFQPAICLLVHIRGQMGMT